MLRYIDRLDDTLYRSIIDKKRRLEEMGKLSDESLDKLEQALEVEFVYNTNSLEGNTLSLGETRLVLKGMTISGKPLTEIQEIKNHPASIDFIKRLAFERAVPVKERDILKLHKITMSKVMEDAGKYRQDDNLAVKGAEFTPSHWYEIRKEMKQLLNFVNENPDGLSPIEIASTYSLFLCPYTPVP